MFAPQTTQKIWEISNFNPFPIHFFLSADDYSNDFVRHSYRFVWSSSQLRYHCTSNAESQRPSPAAVLRQIARLQIEIKVSVLAALWISSQNSNLYCLFRRNGALVDPTSETEKELKAELERVAKVSVEADGHCDTMQVHLSIWIFFSFFADTRRRRWRYDEIPWFQIPRAEIGPDQHPRIQVNNMKFPCVEHSWAPITPEVQFSIFEMCSSCETTVD